MSESAKLEELIAATLESMRANGYSISHIAGYERVYSSLRTFCRKGGIELYTEDVGDAFLRAFDARRPSQSLPTLGFYRSCIRRLNFTLAGIAWQPERKPDIAYVSSCFDETVCEYERYLFRTGKTKKHVRVCAHAVARFLQSVQDQGCTALRALRAEHVYIAFQDASDKNTFHNAVSAFLRYAYKYELISAPLDLIVPLTPRHKTVPTVYSPEEVERMLACVGRTTKAGKRDYAIVLLAARLGLRASDIAALKMKNLRRTQEKIVITQVKTKTPLTLPLLPEITAAIDDYIDNARAQTTDPHLFQKVRGTGKIAPDGVGAIVHAAFARSGVALKGRKTGPHALRSSLATALLAEGNDYQAIQQALGHKNIQTTEHYAASDVEQLRACALPVAPPTGNFAALLKAGGLPA